MIEDFCLERGRGGEEGCTSRIIYSNFNYGFNGASKFFRGKLAKIKRLQSLCDT